MDGVMRSFVYAVRGLGYVLKYERNGRIHLLFAFFAFGLGVYLHVTDVELAAIFFAIIIVFLAEIFNTAIEKTLDIIETKHHPMIEIVKDMSAGAVLVAAIAAVMMGVVIFTPYIWRLWAG